MNVLNLTLNHNNANANNANIQLIVLIVKNLKSTFISMMCFLIFLDL